MSGQLVDAAEVADEIVRRLGAPELGEAATQFIRRKAVFAPVSFQAPLFYLPDQWQLHYTAFPDGSLGLQIIDQTTRIIWQHRLRPAHHG